MTAITWNGVFFSWDTTTSQPFSEEQVEDQVVPASQHASLHRFVFLEKLDWTQTCCLTGSELALPSLVKTSSIMVSLKLLVSESIRTQVANLLSNLTQLSVMRIVLVWGGSACVLLLNIASRRCVYHSISSMINNVKRNRYCSGTQDVIYETLEKIISDCKRRVIPVK